MKKYFFVAVFLFPILAYPQGMVDALRYSFTQINGTARSGAMGNAFGALGGDYTSVSINPAGIGIYRSGEFSFTPAFGQTNVDGTYLGSVANDSKFNFNLNSISYVAAIKNGSNESSGLVNVNVGVGYNRLKDFNQNSLIAGKNAKSSFLDHITENANNNIWSDFYEELAWKTDVLIFDDKLKEYWTDIQDAGYGQSQRKIYATRGSIDEYNLTLGLNFNHRLYLGAALGIQDIYYKESTQLFEQDVNNKIPYFDDMEFRTQLRTTGTGFSGKFGVIYKPTNSLRVGASIFTPAFFRMHDTFDTEMMTNLTYKDGPGNFDELSPILEYDYDLETPFRATLSGAWLFSKKGLISLDYEIVDYSKSKLRNGGDGEAFFYENQDIQTVYKAVGNIRLGGEYRLNDNVGLRAGYELYPSAYKNEAFDTTQPNSEADFSVYSAGIGYKQGGFSFDVAYRYNTIKDYNLPYPSPQTNAYPKPTMAEFNTQRSQVLFTLGFRF
jgi:hypothetical protein